jgi:hypothetical protein
MNIDLTLSTETEALLRCLKAVPLGGEIGYHTLTEACGRDVCGKARSRLISARKIALRDCGIAFTVKRGAGLRRVTLDEAPGMGVVARGRIRSSARRASTGIRAIMAASNGASPETGRRLSSEIAALGLIAEIASESNQKAFESKQAPLPPAYAGAAFLRHIGAVDKSEANSGDGTR